MTTDAWSDVKVELPQVGRKDQEVEIELVEPEGQQWSDGVWIDHLDFFKN